jgi:hypothetical protein
MSYINIHKELTEPAANYIETNWILSHKTTFLKKQVLARGAYFCLTPAAFITHAIDTIIGLGIGLGALCTLGIHKPTVKMAINHLSDSKQLFANTYINFLKFINPGAYADLNSSQEPTISAEGNGFLSDFVDKPLRDLARDCRNSDNILKRHITSRLTYALLAISCLVTRAIDGIIGIPAAALSILTLGKFESLNNLAYRTLQAPGIIRDLFICTIKFINPWTE